MTTVMWDGLAVTAAGTGSSVLWLHGYTMRAEVWRPVWENLAGWRHIGLDLPWHGESRSLRRGEDLASLADTVVTAARAAGVVHVVALSFGSVLAVEMAGRHPGAFASWTLSAPSLAAMPHEPAVAQRYADLAALYRRRGIGPHMTDLWMSCPPDIFAGVAARPLAYDSVRSVIERHSWRELENEGMRRLVNRAQRASDLHGVSAPVLVLTGDRDLLSHRACARSVVAAVPSAFLQVLPETGHLAPLEEPAAAASVIGAHLAAAELRR